MSEKILNRLKTKLLEDVGAYEQERTEAQEFFSDYPADKKVVLLTDILGIDDASEWSDEEIENYFDRNAEELIDKAIQHKEIKNFLGVEDEKLRSIGRSEEETMDELVGDNGSLVGGDSGSDRPKHTNDSEIWTAPQQTTKDYQRGATQGRRLYGFFGGTPYSHGMTGGGGMSESKKRVTKEREIREMVEDLLNNKEEKDDLVSRSGHPPDINSNKIPDVEELFRDEKKGSVAHNLDALIDSIKNNRLGKDEIAMVVNAILEKVDTDKIPRRYKKELMSKL